MKSATLGVMLSLLAVAAGSAAAQVYIGLPGNRGGVSAEERARNAEREASRAAVERAMAQQEIQAQRQRDEARARSQAQQQASLRDRANALRETRRREAEADAQDRANGCGIYSPPDRKYSCARRQ